MARIHGKLRAAAQAGSESVLKALLNDPICNALSNDKDGLTALMWAARNGHETCLGLLLPKSDALAQDKGGWTALMHAVRFGREACVGLLLPASDALAQKNNGLTARGLASKYGHDGLADFIDAYALAQSEQAALGVAVSFGAPRGRAIRRV